MIIFELIDAMARDIPNKAVSKDNTFDYVLEKRPNASLIKMEKEFNAIKNSFHLATLDELAHLLLNYEQLSNKISADNQEKLKSLYGNDYLVDIDKLNNNEVSIDNSTRQIIIDISAEDILNDGVPPLFTYYDLQSRYNGMLAYFTYNENPTMNEYMDAIPKRSPQYYTDMAAQNIDKVANAVASLDNGNNYAQADEILQKLEPKNKDDENTKKISITNLLLDIGKIPAKDFLHYIREEYSSNYVYLKKVNMMLIRKLNYMAKENFIIDNLLASIMDEQMNIHLTNINSDITPTTYQALFNLLNNKISKK